MGTLHHRFWFDPGFLTACFFLSDPLEPDPWVDDPFAFMAKCTSHHRISLGREVHYPPSDVILLEIAAVVLMSLIIAWIGLRLKIESFSREGSVWRTGFRVSLLLFPALLIWPRGTLQEPALLAFDFGIAIVNLGLSRLTLSYFFE